MVPLQLQFHQLLLHLLLLHLQAQVGAARDGLVMGTLGRQDHRVEVTIVKKTAKLVRIQNLRILSPAKI